MPRRILNKILQYPSIGRLLSSICGALETPLLDSFHFVDRHFAPGFYAKMWHVFIRVYGTRVVPINQAIAPGNQVSPAEEILDIIRRQPAVSLGWCYCRRKGGVSMTDPWIWSCIHVGTAQSLKQIAMAKPLKSVKIDEVERLVRRADQAGFVHQLITAPNKDYVYVICSCDPKYCVMLRHMGALPATNLVESHFIVSQDASRCVNCGTCVKRCHFGARIIEGGKLTWIPARCFGCGLCVSACPEKALILVRRPRDVPKPYIPMKTAPK